jgi:hypothetical protein
MYMAIEISEGCFVPVPGVTGGEGMDVTETEEGFLRWFWLKGRIGLEFEANSTGGDERDGRRVALTSIAFSNMLA